MSEVFFWVRMCVRIATLSAWEMALERGALCCKTWQLSIQWTFISMADERLQRGRAF